ncbi:MAG TPA: hypothetical protein VNK95_17890, partial [Caldilineaceae bacterium]|nr:hypothetical protein [Caldilineaceae bacterium]
DFRRKVAPSTPNQVHPLPPAEAGPPPSDERPLPPAEVIEAEGPEGGFDDEWMEDPATLEPGPFEPEPAWSPMPVAALDAPEQPLPERQLPDEPAPARQPTPYLLLLAPVTDLDDQVALLRFVAEARPVVISQVEEALDADYVILIGPAGDADADLAEARLRDLGIACERITGRPAQVFAPNGDLDLS